MQFRSAIIGALALVGLSAPSFATPIYATPIASGSMISLAGGAVYSDQGITFLSNGKAGIVADTSTGSFAKPFDRGCASCGRFYDFSFADFSGPTEIYSATLRGVSTTLELTSLSDVEVTPTSLELIGTGVLTLTGYAPTPGTFYLSSQAKENAHVSFSATSTAVMPEPATMAVLGAGLLGAALIRRRK